MTVPTETWVLPRPRKDAYVGSSEHPNWKGDGAGQKAFHVWLRRHYPKAGRCEKCGCESKTHYAFLRHPAPYTRERSDYAELCPKCHHLMDKRKTHCKRGHEFTPENTVNARDGQRTCRICLRASQLRHYYRNRERILESKKKKKKP